MKSTMTEQKEFYVLGLQIRTSNAKEMAGEGNIQRLWGRFFEEQILSKVSAKPDETLYGVYHGYESDMNGDYLLTIGVKAEANTKIPEGLKLAKVPAQKYMKFTTDPGEMPAVVIEGWQHVWKTELNRSYSADYEIYDHRCVDPKSAQIDILIGVK